MKTLRIMWLLNHGAARKFELAMLRRLGVREIFTPKRFPSQPGFRSASVDYAGDAELSLPAVDLEILNAADWYGEPGRRAWEIANRHFDALFFLPYDGRNIRSIIDNFRGAILLRAYGLAADIGYADALEAAAGLRLESLLRPAKERFYFAQAYPHLHLNEPPALSERRLFLPLGLASSAAPEPWQGTNKKVFFICPDIGLDGYYRSVYQNFLRDFGGYPYAIGGMQPVEVSNPHVLGFVPARQHRANLRDLRLMYYHSAEPRHIHYHPFEAVHAGMPLVFMGGGMLDRLGGADLPGRCANVQQAQKKIRRMLDDDTRLIGQIRDSQGVLLEPMEFERCVTDWQAALKALSAQAARRAAMPEPVVNRRKRIALILPVAYRGGTLRGAALLAQALQAGAGAAGQEIDIVLGHRDDPDAYAPDAFGDFPSSVQRRPYRWKTFDAATARRALAYAGREPLAVEPEYWVPEDGIAQFTDCDFWLVVSDRLEKPLLPLRPHALLVYDYIQRYEELLPAATDRAYAQAARNADRVFVTTEFTRRDAVQYAGAEPARVLRLPMLMPTFAPPNPAPETAADYFLWSTNPAIHKNHENAVRALILYYSEHAGKLECRISGVDSDKLFASDVPHLRPLPGLLRAAPEAQRRIRVLGELQESAYRQAVAAAAFVWHPCRVDNGSFSVAEAAACRVPGLSCDYPAMREMDAELGLNLAWMNANDPADMARALKRMEGAWRQRRDLLPPAESLSAHGPQALGKFWWEAVLQCL